MDLIANLQDAVILAVLGMGTVMILLFVIQIMINILGKIFGPKTNVQQDPKPAGAAATQSAPAAAPAASGTEEEIVAVLTAAVAAYLGTSADNVRLVVRPIQTSAAWAQAGRLEQHN